MENVEKKQKVDTIIVVAPTIKAYKSWRHDLGADSVESCGNIKYHCVTRINDIRGREFISVVKLHGITKLKDYIEIEKRIEVVLGRKHKHYEGEQGE